MLIIDRAPLCFNFQSSRFRHLQLIFLEACQCMLAEKRWQCDFLANIIIIGLHYAGIITLQLKPTYNEGEKIVF